MAKDNKGKNGASTQAGAPGSGGGLGVWGLAGVVVSSMIGGGIYSLPQNMAAGASAGAAFASPEPHIGSSTANRSATSVPITTW